MNDTSSDLETLLATDGFKWLSYKTKQFIRDKNPDWKSVPGGLLFVPNDILRKMEQGRNHACNDVTYEPVNPIPNHIKLHSCDEECSIEGPHYVTPHYKDPLKAAWMAQHFGMYYRQYDECGYPHVIGGVVAIIKDMAWGGRIHNNPDKGYGMSKPYKLYLNINCLHLLEPQVGDVIQGKLVGAFHGKGLKGEWFYRCADNIAVTTEGKIIQRKGIAFMWPEAEPD